jgi:hypothetical protein
LSRMAFRESRASCARNSTLLITELFSFVFCTRSPNASSVSPSVRAEVSTAPQLKTVVAPGELNGFLLDFKRANNPLTNARPGRPI